jgi:hypothetical protein
LDVAFDCAGDPIAFCETVLDRTWAGVFAFMAAHTGTDTRLARYALHAHLAGELADLGVGSLTVGGSALLSSPGLRYHQQLTGFVPVLLKPVVDSRPVPAPAAWQPPLRVLIAPGDAAPCASVGHDRPVAASPVPVLLP